MKKLFIIPLFFLFLSFSASAQTDLHTKNKKAIKYYALAESYIQGRQFDPAIEALENALKEDNQFIDAYFKLGSIYMLYAKNSIAKKYYMKGADLDTNNVKSATAYFIVGEISIKEGDYATAKKYFQYVMNVKPNNKKLTDKAPKYMETCIFAVEAMKHPVAFKPVILPNNINNSFVQAYPVVTADRKTLLYTVRSGQKSTDDENIFTSKWENGKWATPYSISTTINTKYNEGASSMSADGKTIVFASCNRADGVGSCDIYISYKEGEEWSVPENMGKKVNAAGWDSEPSLSADGKVLYFSSERSGGYGREDIYVSYKQENGTWGVAKNLGPVINTEGREVSSFIHASGSTLYFSTNNRPGMGEFDIFRSDLGDTSWTTPVNVGYPINTADNDATLFITADNEKGYYSVYDKKDYNNMRSYLYEFDVPEVLKAKHKSTYAKGKVFDADTKKPLKADIELYNLATAARMQWCTSDSINGGYILVLSEGMDYAVHAGKKGYLFESIQFNYKNAKAFDPLTLDIYLKPIKKGATTKLNNIYYETNSYALDSRSTAELNKLLAFMKLNATTKLELAGHTDNVGNEADNLKLSGNRAKAVYDYLISKGADKTRLTFKGYGKSVPVADNGTEDGRAKNRRLEVKVF
ncbi:MAG: yiaD [Cytophagaceae bacterium]|jgi:outer membrane protein OmpA-like peptidoglycan-associated protein|nr:yiaD [Cytophagaceae bacterium]